MLRIRLHGRGGQGIKTASQILGSAGFIAGLQAQDFPLYGAERRGAPITAYTRLAIEFILERGPILHPDLILVGDETLLEDPLTTPMSGANNSTMLFINSSHSAERLQEHFHLPSLPVTFDLTALYLRYFHHGMILSSALAAVGARLIGLISLDTLLEAVRMELEELGIGKDVLQKNLDLVKEIYSVLPVVTMQTVEEEPLTGNSMISMQQETVASAAPLVLAHANMYMKKTGNWRTQRPEIDLDHCNGCWICFARCPDGSIHIDENGKPVIDYDHCKGCLICSVECPTECISTVREVTSWV